MKTKIKTHILQSIQKYVQQKLKFDTKGIQILSDNQDKISFCCIVQRMHDMCDP